MDSIQSENHSQKRKTNQIFVNRKHLDTELKDYFLKGKFTRNAKFDWIFDSESIITYDIEKIDWLKKKDKNWLIYWFIDFIVCNF